MIGSYLAARIVGRTRPLRLLAAFPNHVYLLPDAGPVLIAQRAGQVPGPLTLDLDHWPDWDRPAALAAGGLRVGDRVMPFGKVEETALPAGPAPDAARLWQAVPDHHGSALLQRLRGDRAWDPAGLRAGLAAGQGEQAAARLAGLGRGLTPAGDDLLAGAMLACHAMGQGGLAAGLLAGAEGRTTTLSLALLRASAAGHAPRDWRALIAGLRGGGGIAAPLASVLAHGASSGGDMLSGFMAVLTPLPGRHAGRAAPRG